MKDWSARKKPGLAGEQWRATEGTWNKKGKLAQVPSTELGEAECLGNYWGIWLLSPSIKVFRRLESKLIPYFGHLMWEKLSSLRISLRIPHCFIMKRPQQYLITHNNSWETTISGFFFSCIFAQCWQWIKAWWKSGICWGCLRTRYHTYKTTLRAQQACLPISQTLSPHPWFRNYSVLTIIYSKNHAKCASPGGSHVRLEATEIIIPETKWRDPPCQPWHPKAKSRVCWLRRRGAMRCNDMGISSVLRQSATLPTPELQPELLRAPSSLLGAPRGSHTPGALQGSSHQAALQHMIAPAHHLPLQVMPWRAIPSRGIHPLPPQSPQTRRELCWKSSLSLIPARHWFSSSCYNETGN